MTSRATAPSLPTTLPGATKGLFAQLNYDLTGLARVKEGRKPEPIASVIDTQSVKTSNKVPLTSQGTDGAKKIVGRRRGILTDTIGFILAVIVTAVGLSENALGIRLLNQAKEKSSTIRRSWVDTGFKNVVVGYGARLGTDVEVVDRNPDARGFHVVKGAGWSRAGYRLDCDAPSSRPRLRDPHHQLRSRDPHRIGRRPRQTHNGRDRHPRDTE
ncbi:hypothetical protein QFZ75_003317 [Streptomyces sp. V3I8]|nr:hypothetical protein [Streptomyces sp. V3I8]